MPTRTSRTTRACGSVLFTAAGAFYVLAPPNTTTAYFDTPWPAILWGLVFLVGGIMSLVGTLTQYVHVERLGVLWCAIAAAMLTLGQAAVMLDHPVTWTRGGGTLVYAGFAAWAFERWMRLAPDEKAIAALAHEE